MRDIYSHNSDKLNIIKVFQVITDSDIKETNDDNTRTLNEDSDIDIESVYSTVQLLY